MKHKQTGFTSTKLLILIALLGSFPVLIVMGLWEANRSQLETLSPQNTELTKSLSQDKEPVKRLSKKKQNELRRTRDSERETAVTTLATIIIAGKIAEDFSRYDRISFPKSAIMKIVDELGYSIPGNCSLRPSS